MKLIIQIPCFNESQTLPDVIQDLPTEIEGIDKIEILVIDDGSTDGTAATAMMLGAHYVVRQKRNKGLAAAFSAGLDACLQLEADIIVNTDGDHQYPGEYIPDLIRPILSGDAELVVGDRRPGKDRRFSLPKRILQKLGSRTVSYLAGITVPDAVSGFRAYSREAALNTNIFTNFSYTTESIIQTGSKGLPIAFVPIHTNNCTRPSRLFRSTTQFVSRSAATMLRVFFMYKPLNVLWGASSFFAIIGLIPVFRFLKFWLDGAGQGHIQSLVLGAAFIVVGAILAIAGLLADLVATNRKLLEQILIQTKKQKWHEAIQTEQSIGANAERN